MTSTLGYSYIGDENNNKSKFSNTRPELVSKPKRNKTIRKRKNFLNGIKKILSKTDDDEDDLDDFNPLNKEDEVNNNDNLGNPGNIDDNHDDSDDKEISMQSFKQMSTDNESVKSYMEAFTEMGGQPINENTVSGVESTNQVKPQQNINDITEGYISSYVPYYTKLNNSKDLHGSEDTLMKKLNYMIHLLEEQQDQRTENVTEELVLYSFLGIFVIFVVDAFARAGKYTR